MNDRARAWAIATRLSDEEWAVDWLGTGSGKGFAERERRDGIKVATDLIAAALAAVRAEHLTVFIVLCNGKVDMVFDTLAAAEQHRLALQQGWNLTEIVTKEVFHV